jgi:hypothetical protein
MLSSLSPRGRSPSMDGTAIGKNALRGSALLVALCLSWQGRAQQMASPYPSMAPLNQYLIADGSEETALARSAAPESISGDADVLILTSHGYETAVKGKNGFTCLVYRSWAAGKDDPDFWNPKLRAPICLNAQAARFYVPLNAKKTELVLKGNTKAQMFDAVEDAIEKKELPTLEAGAMAYMMSKQQYLSDDVKQWHPHLMFFSSLTDPGEWGANLPHSPVIAIKDSIERSTTFLVPIRRWSDGTADGSDGR